MKCLSLRQPWLWWIFHGKMLENRKWNTHYRGPVLLHAAKGCMAREYDDASAFVEERFGLALAAQMPPRGALPRGGILGRARIVDVLPPRYVTGVPHLWGDADKWYADGIDGRWHMTEQFAFVLADVESLPFTPYKGALGLFEVDERALAI